MSRICYLCIYLGPYVFEINILFITMQPVLSLSVKAYNLVNE